MTHFQGGDATDRFAKLQTIQDWVEEDRAPDRIVDSSSAMGISRPLYPHPEIARYAGGDPSSADSFVCRN